MKPDENTRTCHLCGATVPKTESCPACVENFSQRRPATEMTGEEREIEMRQMEGPMELPFDMLHQRIEELVGRPVWTHEMGLNWEGLVAEASHQHHPTFEQITELIPEEKRIIVDLRDA